jgi:hypothetical protein
MEAASPQCVRGTAGGCSAADVSSTEIGCPGAANRPCRQLTADNAGMRDGPLIRAGYPEPPLIRKNERELWSPPIWVDFNDLDGERLPITESGGTTDDLRRHAVVLKDGLKLTLFTLDGTKAAQVDDLVGVGTVTRDPASGWVALVPWTTLRHVSELDPIDRQLYLHVRPEGFSGAADDL